MSGNMKTRRDILKKAGRTAFIVPTVMSFNTRELKAYVSRPFNVSQITGHFNTPDSTVRPFFENKQNFNAFYELKMQDQHHLIDIMSDFLKEQHDQYMAILRNFL